MCPVVFWMLCLFFELYICCTYSVSRKCYISFHKHLNVKSIRYKIELTRWQNLPVLCFVFRITRNNKIWSTRRYENKLEVWNHRRSAHRGQGGGPGPPPQWFLWKRWYFSFRLAYLNRNCVQYYNTNLLVYCTVYTTKISM